jgi:hypothetical protein
MNSSPVIGWILTGIFFIVVAGLVIGALYYLWVFLTPLLRKGLIKLNSERAKAIILEVKEIGNGYIVRSNMTSTYTVQPVRVKLEVHPNTGSPYIAYDRLKAKGRYFLPLGGEMQVEVSRFNPHWVVSLPETTTHEGEQSQKAELLKVKEMLASGSITSQDYTKKVQEIFPGMSGISSISSGQSANDPKAELGKMKEMLDSGLITQQDYEKKKDEILSKM